MLRSLDIRDILIIDRLELEFQPGLNVLTGETGAGKSILLDSLGFVLGWRGRAELVRDGAEQGEVTASFDLPKGHPCFDVLQDAGLEAEDELILRRVNSKDGRKTAWINGRRAPADVLRALSDTLLELHGQHDDRGLLDPKGHMRLLDSFAQNETELSACRSAWKTLSKARKSLTEAEARVAKAQADEDFVRHAIAELDALDAQPGEDAELDSRRRMMQAAERIRSDIAQAHDALSLQGAEGQISDAMRWLQGATKDTGERLNETLNALERLLVELDTAQRGVQDCLDALTFNPQDLDEAEERLFAIRALARKHNIGADDLARYASELRERLKAIDGGADEIKALRAAVIDAEDAYAKASGALTANRVKSAERLDKAMQAELAPLKMERAVFETRITEGPAGPDGVDDVAFLVATNPGAPSGPLNKIASGGELSRFLLALKVCLTKDRKDGLTMIFDEIDRGVGGATADAVGRRLKSIAAGGQVLVVTHSPQVAALGAHHWRVEKRQGENSTLTNVVELGDADRVTEIARMLSGDEITAEARAAAKSLLSK